MKRITAIALSFVALAQGAANTQGGVAIAALPDIETYNFVLKKYNLLIRQSRDGCVSFADPKFIVARSEKPDRSDKNIRQLIVLQTMTRRGGSACEGVFQFQYADANCRTNEITYTDGIGSPATWKTSKYSDPAMVQKICALPTVEFATPTQNLPPAK